MGGGGLDPSGRDWEHLGTSWVELGVSLPQPRGIGGNFALGGGIWGTCAPARGDQGHLGITRRPGGVSALAGGLRGALHSNREWVMVWPRAGIDLMGMGSEFTMVEGEDRARKAWNLRRKICEYQETFSVLEKCPKPVIAVVHGACVGAGVDLISACDIRYCAQDAWFQVKEVDIGLVADVGTLQHLLKIMGSQSLINELAFTTHKMMAPEAQSSSLVSRVFADKETLLQGALEVATTIAARSPMAVQGTKVNLLCSWDHPVPKSLCYVATWNMSMLQTEDILKSVQVAMEKKGPEDVPFSKL
ncbi:delta(3,5)-Delta(2,4)-dienoyl-CoA isomerase, mitochondrial-like [Morphnus guianensis]